MKKFLASAAVLALLTGGAFAGNVSDVDQIGDFNAQLTDQSGNLNMSTTLQINPVPLAAGNLSLTFQDGLANASTTLQLGGNNQSLTDQWGIGNSATTAQVGFNGHVSMTDQIGVGNQSITIQTD